MQRRITLSCLAGLALSGCGHIIHPAAVQPGFTLDVVPAHEITRHESKGQSHAPGDFPAFTSSRPTLQVAAGYGWRLTEHRALQLQVSAGTLTLPTLDGYAQFLAAPLDLGIGLALGVPGFLSPYLMAGKQLTDGATRLRIDGGARVLLIDEPYGPNHAAGSAMLLASVQRGRWGAGLWSDTIYFPSPQYYVYCDENCMAEDLARWRLSVGAYLQVRWNPF